MTQAHAQADLKQKHAPGETNMSQSTCWTGCREQTFPLPASEDRASHSEQLPTPSIQAIPESTEN